MDNTVILSLLTLSLPAITALTCIVLLMSFYNKSKDANTRSLYSALLFFFVLIAFNWIYGILYVCQCEVLPKIDPFIYCTYLLVQVTLYRYTYILTSLPEEKKFSKKHYIIPTAVLLITVGWSLFIPDAEKIYSATHVDPTGSHFPFYHAWVNTRYWGRAILSLIYMVLAVQRIMRYRREIADYSADSDRSSSNWLLLSVLLMLPMVIIPLGISLFGPLNALTSVGWIIPAILIVIHMVVLCYFTITDYYVIIEENTTENNIDASVPTTTDMIALNKKIFEEYISRKKPYLNPMLKITDLCVDLHTNRTYLSAFINKGYGMNFRQYVNSLRLKDAAKLQLDNEYSNEEKEELIRSLGFGSMRSYLRARNGNATI